METKAKVRGNGQRESARIALQKRCCDACGADADDPVCATLSYFPAVAELFIKTQDYAAAIEGRRAVWFNVRHKRDGEGLFGRQRFMAGQLEHLHIRGYTAESLHELATSVQYLRGEIESYLTRHLEYLLVVARQDPLVPEIEMKLLDVMGVMESELQQARMIIASRRQSDEVAMAKRRLDEIAKAIESLDHLLVAPLLVPKDDETDVARFARHARELEIAHQPGLKELAGVPVFRFDLTCGTLHSLGTVSAVLQLLVLAYRYSTPEGVGPYRAMDNLRRSGSSANWLRHGTGESPSEWLKNQGVDLQKIIPLVGQD